MDIRVTCTACGNRLTAPIAHAGKLARCPTCKQVIRVPSHYLVPLERCPGAELFDELFAPAPTSQP